MGVVRFWLMELVGNVVWSSLLWLFWVGVVSSVVLRLLNGVAGCCCAVAIEAAVMGWRGLVVWCNCRRCLGFIVNVVV